jgi:hypothetical protein
MKSVGCLFSLALLLYMVAFSTEQKKHAFMVGSAAKGAESAGLQVAPDLSERLAKFRQIHVPFHSAGLSVRERELVEKLVDASRYLEEIYWRQIDPEALTLYVAFGEHCSERCEAAALFMDQCLPLRSD